MRRGLFIFILGITCGILYTQNEGFKEWADEGLDMGKEFFTGWFDDAKDDVTDSVKNLKNDTDEFKDEKK